MSKTELFVAAINFVKADANIAQHIHNRDNDPNLDLMQVICRAYRHNGELGFWLEIIFDYQFRNNAPGQPDMVFRVLPKAQGGFVFMH